MIITDLHQTPTDKLDYTIDFTSWLELVGDTISTVAWTIPAEGGILAEGCLAIAKGTKHKQAAQARSIKPMRSDDGSIANQVLSRKRQSLSQRDLNKGPSAIRRVA